MNQELLKNHFVVLTNKDRKLNFFKNENLITYLKYETKDQLKKDLKVLNPNLVIVLDKEIKNDIMLSQQFQKIDDAYFMHLEYEDKDTILAINAFLKSKAILKVTNFSIYYLDVYGHINHYDNTEQNDYYFVSSQVESPYKSIFGENLEKVARTTKHEDGFEGHLSKKDFFYYNNINKIRHSTFLPYVVFDIETNDSLECENPDKEVISISFFSNVTNEYTILYLKNENNKNLNSDVQHIYQNVDIKQKIKVIPYEKEKDLIYEFLNVHLNQREHILLMGWNISGFDMKYLLNRAKQFGLTLSDWDSNAALRNKCTSFKDYIIFDGLDYYRTKGTFFNKPPKYSLDSVYKFLFETEIGKIKKAMNNEMWNTDINSLLLYNIRDVQMTTEIILKLRFLDYAKLVQTLIPQDFDNVFFNSKTIENLLHHKYWNQRIFLPSKKEHIKVDYDGAIVFDPQKGIFENVSVFDFSAMYTSIYITFNISPDTYLGSKEIVNSKIEELKTKYNFNSIDDLILIENDFETSVFLPHHIKLGCLPKLELELLQKRKEMQRERDKFNPNTPEYRIYEQLQATFKEILNSIYGVSSFDKFILFNQCISASITSIARQLLIHTKEFAIQQNFVPLYGDTDSIFIRIKSKTLNELIDSSNNFINQLNSSWAKFVEKFTNSKVEKQHLLLKIEFEKCFSKILLTDVKKRYFGYLSFYKNQILKSPYLTITGFETRRDDTPIFFKKKLKNVYEIFLNENYKENIMSLYSTMLEEIKKEDIENLIVRLKISKDEYKHTPIHIRAYKNAGKIPRMGDEVNMIYVLDDIEVLHYDELTMNEKQLKLDYKKYIKNFFVQKIKLLDNELYDRLLLIEKIGNNLTLDKFINT